MPNQFSLFSSPRTRPAPAPALQRLPKVDLHRHLLGSVTADMVLELARIHTIPLPTQSIDALNDLLTVTQPVNGLRPFFRPWSLLSRLITSPDVLTDLVYLVLCDAKRDNVVYTELRAGWGMTGRESFGVIAFLEAFGVGIERAEREVGVLGRLIFGITRHIFARHDQSQRKRLWHDILSAVDAYRDRVVVGFDLAGVEDGYPPREFKEEFDDVRTLGIPATIHCGETTGPADVWESLDVLHASRLGHALAATSDHRLLARLAQTQIPIEVCPTSNWLTSTVADLRAHPLSSMLARGLNVTIHTDNPAICLTTLTEEYALLTEALGVPDEDVAQIVRQTFASSFAPPDVQLRLKLAAQQGIL